MHIVKRWFGGRTSDDHAWVQAWADSGCYISLRDYKLAVQRYHGQSKEMRIEENVAFFRKKESSALGCC